MKKIMKIGHYFATIWTKGCGLLLGPPCSYCCLYPLWQYWLL